VRVYARRTCGEPLNRHFDRVVATSDIRFEGIRLGDHPEAMLAQVNAGVDLEAFTSRVRVPAERMHESLGIPTGHLHVAFVGNARPEDAEHVRALVARLERAGAASDVSCLGGRKDVPDVLNAADVALHASTLPEPFGPVLVEALALGKPLIAARRGGPIQRVSEATGILLDPSDPLELIEALERLLDDPDLRKSMGAAARLRAQQFTARRMADGMQRLWEELLAGRPPVGADG
jgi:glycosyltransferase involved in cell wall biosynthesis